MFSLFLTELTIIYFFLSKSLPLMSSGINKIKNVLAQNPNYIIKKN